MSFEYLSARLKAIRGGFVNDNDIESLFSGKELNAIVLLLSDSVFGEEVEKLTAKTGKKMSSASIERCISEGFLTIVQKVYHIIRRVYPKTTDVVFSRWELEQIKYAIRYFSYSEPVYEKRFRFLPLFSKSDWVANWRSFESLFQFKEALEKINHPFAKAVEVSESATDLVQVEINLERYYFQNYLMENKNSVEKTWEYFIDQCDMVNVQQCYLLRENPEYYDQMEKYFIDGPGRLNLEDCRQLIRSIPAEFLQRVESKFHCSLKAGSESSSALFSLSLRQYFLRKYLRKSMESPDSLWTFFHFMEELNVMVSNLYLATRFSQSKVSFKEVTGYFVSRKIA